MIYRHAGSTSRTSRLGQFKAFSLGAFVVLFAAVSAPALAQDDDENVHEALFEQGREGDVPYYPSASECKQCHPDHYREWSVSPHAYAQFSPVFNAMHGKILELTNGSNGDFCIRCHTPVGMNRNEPVFMTNIDRHPTSREGVTCIVCHRVNKGYGKISGRIALVDGPLEKPIFGPKGNENFYEEFGEQIEEKFGEDKVHSETQRFFQLTDSSFCGICHDVNLRNGFRLEEAFSEFKRSPASEEGVSCQDCHMGVEQGAFTGDPETNYEKKQIARISRQWVGEERRKTSHVFAGPDHSVIHPGIFPHNQDAAEFATIREWLKFDYEAGWGTEEFEQEEFERQDAGRPTLFPPRWENIDERYEARDIIYDNLDRLKWYQEKRLEVLRNGYGLGEIKVTRATPKRLAYEVEVKNLTDGHQVPTGFIAERVTYLQTEVFGPDGERVFVSGDLDPNFDVRDLHSLYVHNAELPLDKQLFSLQSSFVTRNVRGSEREQVLAVNFSPSPLPFIRPAPFASTLTGSPAGVRIHKRNIAPEGSKSAKYKVDRKLMTGPGTYTVKVRLIAGMVPINLIDAIKSVGFDYGMSAWEIALGVRFGVGDVIDNETGEPVSREAVLAAAENEDLEALRNLYGVLGGHSVLAEKTLTIEVGDGAASEPVVQSRAATR